MGHHPAPLGPGEEAPQAVLWDLTSLGAGNSGWGYWDEEERHPVLLSSEACPGLGVGMQAPALALGQRRLARPCLAPCPGVPGLWVMEGGLC